MFTIGAADYYGLPVSTTHVLSSGIAGTMAANHTGLQWSTVRNLALAWVLSRGEHVVPIPGTKRVPYLEENLAAADVELSEDEARRIGEEVPAAAGDRYDREGMTTINR